jgi:hypothetical protein
VHLPCTTSISTDIRVFSLTIRIGFSEASTVASVEALWRTSPSGDLLEDETSGDKL